MILAFVVDLEVLGVLLVDLEGLVLLVLLMLRAGLGARPSGSPEPRAKAAIADDEDGAKDEGGGKGSKAGKKGRGKEKSEKVVKSLKRRKFRS